VAIRWHSGPSFTMCSFRGILQSIENVTKEGWPSGLRHRSFATTESQKNGLGDPLPSRWTLRGEIALLFVNNLPVVVDADAEDILRD
jgi:hypothetical protein